MPTTIIDDSGAPVEIAPGRGDLNRSSSLLGPEGFIPNDLSLIGNRTVSFAKLFQTQPWIAAAVMRMLTWSIRVPLKVYRRTGEDSRERLRGEDHPLAAALASPWERGYTGALIQALLGPVLVHGNSVCEVEQGARDTIRFGPKDWRFSRPLYAWRDTLAGFKFDIDDPKISREVGIDSVLHCTWWSPMGPIGTSPLQQLGTTLRIEDAAQRYQQALFTQGARPPSAVTASDAFLGLDPAERQLLMTQLRADLQALYGLPENAGKPALLPPGLDWKAIGHSAVEAELIDQRKVARDEVVAVYLIPPPMLGILDKATFSNIEVQREMIYTDCVGPPLVLIEQIINAQLVLNLLREDDVYCEFDFGAVLRGDRLKEIEAIREAIATAVMTPNEGRTKQNMPKSNDPAMDKFYLPANNLQPVGSPPVPTGSNQESGQARVLHVRSRERNYEKVFT
jgi:HK97 family phage portal protein